MPAGACPHCGNALGSRDHEEDCATPRPTRRRRAVPTGPVPDSTAATAEKAAELLRQLRERNKT